MNKAILQGRLGKDPELREASTGLKICTFSLATSEKYKGEEKTEWHNVVFFGKPAEIIHEYVNKGDSITVVGKIEYQSWEKDGEKKYKTVINAREFYFGDRAKPKSQDPGQPSNGDDEDMPF